MNAQQNVIPSSQNLWWRLIRTGFRLLYNELAWTYDLVSWGVSLGHWRKWQRAAIEHLRVQRGASVLELAHGTGNTQLDMLAEGIHTIGLDLSPYMGRITRRKLFLAGHTPRLARGMAQHLPFPDRTFDAIISTFPTEFIVQPETLSEAYRVLKTGARLIVVPNGQLELTSLLARLIERLYIVTGQRNPWPDAMEKPFIQAGFEVNILLEQLEGSKVWIAVAQK